LPLVELKGDIIVSQTRINLSDGGYMTSATEMHELHWHLLVEKVYEGRCVPFLGAGVNASTADYQGLPLGNEVTLRLLERMSGRRISKLEDLIEVKVDPILAQFEGLVPDNLLELTRVAEYVRQSTDRKYLLDAVQAVLADKDREPSQLLETLAGLPFKLIVTCNYDRLMERALEKAGVQYYSVLQPTRGFDSQEAYRVREALAEWTGCVLYKLHGSFGEASSQPSEFIPYNLVLTEDDYIEFMATLSSDERGVPLPIKSQLAQNVLLFLGYSLRDWDWRMLYGMLPHTDRLVISIQKDPPPYWVYYWNQRGVTTYNIDLGDFAEELSTRYSARY
jgi:hypothetical protein